MDARDLLWTFRRWTTPLAFSGCVGFFAGGVRYVSNRPHCIVTGLAVAALAMAVSLVVVAFVKAMSE